MAHDPAFDPGNPPRFCTHCGTRMEAGDAFCGHCGQPLSAARAHPEQQAPASPYADPAGPDSPPAIKPPSRRRYLLAAAGGTLLLVIVLIYLTSSPPDPPRARAYYLANELRTAEAVAALDAAIEQGDTTGWRSREYPRYSHIYLNGGRPSDAVALLQRGRAAYPEDPVILSTLIQAYIASGQIERVQDDYRRAVEQDPGNIHHRSTLGVILLETDRHEEAVAEFRKVLEIDPTYTNAHYWLGETYVALADAAYERRRRLAEVPASQLSDDELDERSAETERLIDYQETLLGQAFSTLERALELAEAENRDLDNICYSLSSAYLLSERREKTEAAPGAAACGWQSLMTDR